MDLTFPLSMIESPTTHLLPRSTVCQAYGVIERKTNQEIVMAQQKQGGGKAGKGAKRVVNQVSQNKGRAAFKQTAQYLRGPKDGGPTLAERVAKVDAEKKRLQLEAEQRTGHWRYYW